MPAYNITININSVETENPALVEQLCRMMVDICNDVCRNATYDAIKRYESVYYGIKRSRD